MGVKGLTGLLQKLAPDAVRRKHISDYRGKTLAVDVSCFLNRFIYGLDPHPARVQRGVYKLCMFLKLHGIRPIFVFDGPGRIIEKQRETRRREALKQKVERSFRFEKERKESLRGLRGSAQLLQTYSPDVVSSILDDIRLQSDAATRTVRVASANRPPSDGDLLVNHEDGKATRTDGHEAELMAPVRETLLKSPDWNSLDARILTDSVEASNHDDQTWIAPATTEDGQADLDTHLQRSSSFYEAGAPLFDAGMADESHEMDLFERELDTLDRLELDIETVDGLDIIQDLADTNASLLSNEIPQILRTGTSITAIIPSSDMMQIAKEDPSDPDFDGKVRKKVHEALENFVRSVESRAQGSLELAAEITTQRQKELTALEEKLVQEIKETSRGNIRKQASRFAPALDVSQPSQDLSALGSEEREKEPSTVPTILTSTTTTTTTTATTATQEEPVEQDATAKDENADFSSTPELTQDGFAADTAESTNTIAVAATVDMADMATMVDTADTVDIADMASMVDTLNTADAADTIPAESDDTRTSNEENRVEGSAVETEEQDMRSMIFNVLSAHQSLFTSLERRTLRVTRPLVLACQSLLQAMGEPVIEAFDAEAESVCAHLTTLGVADASVSEDTDTAVFGNGLLLRQVAVGGEKDILEIDPLVAHATLGMSRDAFRDFCILCGTDFSGTIEGIGPLRAVQLVQYYGSIESILANVSDKYKPRPDFLYDQARRVFDRKPQVSLDPTLYECNPEIQPLLSELLLKYGIDANEAKDEILSDAGLAGGPSGTGLGSSLGTGSFGADPFRASVIDIPGTASSSFSGQNMG